MLLRLDCKFKRKEKHLFCRFPYTLQGLCLHYLFSSNADSSENTYFEELSEEQIIYVLTDAK